jgi:hypothetical protein
MLMPRSAVVADRHRAATGYRSMSWPALEHVDHTRVLELPAGNLQRLVGERGQPEATAAQPAQRGGDLRMGSAE